MVEVEVLIDNFKDNEVYNTEIIVKRNGKEVKLLNKLLQKGDVYYIRKERYVLLSKKGLVAKAKQDKKEE